MEIVVIVVICIVVFLYILYRVWRHIVKRKNEQMYREYMAYLGLIFGDEIKNDIENGVPYNLLVGFYDGEDKERSEGIDR